MAGFNRNRKWLCLVLALLFFVILSCTQEQQAPLQTAVAQAGQTALAEGEKALQTQAASLLQTAAVKVPTEAAAFLETARARAPTEAARLLQTAQAFLATQSAGKPPLDYFALGDSIASGHGLMDDASACRRSALAYPYKVAQSLSADYAVNFPADHFLACSGATAFSTDPASCSGESRYKCFHNQFEDMLSQIRDDRPTLVSITIGANDMNWTDFGGVAYRLVQDTTSYLDWANQVGAGLGAELRTDLGPLLSQHPNLTVVITQIHNPFNPQSWFFLGSGATNSCKLLWGALDCYEKTDYGISALNNAIVLDAYVNLGRPAAIRFGVINAAFSGHASTCGSDPVADSWIQNPDDASSSSNSYPGLPDWFLNLLPPTPRPWTGDCFHPNETGARQYADSVVEAFLRP